MYKNTLIFNFWRLIVAIIIPCMMCSITFIRLSELIIVYTDHVQNCSLTLMLMMQYQNWSTSKVVIENDHMHSNEQAHYRLTLYMIFILPLNVAENYMP